MSLSYVYCCYIGRLNPLFACFTFQIYKKNNSIKSENRCLQDRNDESSNVTRNLKPKFSGYFNNLDFDRNMKQYERIVHEDFEITTRKVVFVQFATTKLYRFGMSFMKPCRQTLLEPTN